MAQQRFLFHVAGDEARQTDLELASRERAGTFSPSHERTYAQARLDLFRALRGKGFWELSSTELKVPYATSPGRGDLRLWFKPQAVHYTRSEFVSGHKRGDARALPMDAPDIRRVSPEDFLAWVEQWRKAGR